MLRSMTGYGRGEQLGDDRSIVVEARSVNHRFLDVSVRITRAFCSLENEIKKMASAYVSRGKVDVSIQYEPGSSAAPSLSVNAAAAGHVHALLEQVKRDLGVTGDIGMDTLLAFREMIFEQKGEDVTVEQYRQWLQPVLEQAFAALKEMQAAEGAEIGKDILARLGVIGTTLEQIEAVFPAALQERQTALQERVAALCGDVEIDEARMVQELAIMADKSDVTEELVRAKSHIKQFRQWFDTSEPVGRKLDFLLQEINREVNTIGSKSSDSEIALSVVAVKNELEKIREQIQNVM